MKAYQHFVIGGTAAVLPDFFLLFFGWRKEWIPESHPLVRLHRFLHSTHGLIFIITLGALSHVVADWFSPHRRADT